MMGMMLQVQGLLLEFDQLATKISSSGEEAVPPTPFNGGGTEIAQLPVGPEEAPVCSASDRLRLKLLEFTTNASPSVSVEAVPLLSRCSGIRWALTPILFRVGHS